MQLEMGKLRTQSRKLPVLWASWSCRNQDGTDLGMMSKRLLGLFTLSLWKVPRAALLAWHLCSLCQ